MYKFILKNVHLKTKIKNRIERKTWGEQWLILREHPEIHLHLFTMRVLQILQIIFIITYKINQVDTYRNDLMGNISLSDVNLYGVT